MAAEIYMPKNGMDMTEGTLIRWLKEVGDPVTEGEAIMEIETDKVTMEAEAPASGILLQKLYEDGAVVSLPPARNSLPPPPLLPLFSPQNTLRRKSLSHIKPLSLAADQPVTSRQSARRSWAPGSFSLKKTPWAELV